MKLEAVTMLYSQEADSCDGESACGSQWLEIKTQDAGCGTYVVIKTERWALCPESLEELAKEVKRVMEMIPVEKD